MKILAVWHSGYGESNTYRPILIVKTESMYWAYDLIGKFDFQYRKMYSKMECVELKNIKPIFYKLVIRFIFGQQISLIDYYNNNAFEVDTQ